MRACALRDLDREAADAARGSGDEDPAADDGDRARRAEIERVGDEADLGCDRITATSL
ncbi:MAG: hypothetical protein QM820_32900 [Minicystis sp.]